VTGVSARSSVATTSSVALIAKTRQSSGRREKRRANEDVGMF
jgi:hypothetical protein